MAETKVSPAEINMPYAFSAYRSTALTPTGDVVFNFDTKVFDIGTNYNAATGLFTAPVAGIYWFSTMLYTATSQAFYSAEIYKNGSQYRYLGGVNVSTAVTFANGGTLVQMAAGDTVGIAAHSASNVALVIASTQNYFDGFLVRQT